MAQFSAAARQKSLAGAAMMGSAIVGLSSWYSSCQKNAPIESNKVEVHLMDKIQQKEYLSAARDAIPSTLRILAIDMPELRNHAFEGDCRLTHDKIFADDVASPKVIVVGNSETEGESSSKTKKDDQSKKGTKLKVTQKALVKSLVQCRSSQSQQRVGVELLEASIADLNKYKLRKTQQFGSFKYDPGKYYTASSDDNNKKENGDNNGDSNTMPPATNESSSSVIVEEQVPLDKASFEDELEAPWNQYAWAEEMRLRINGQVGFDAPLEKASPWNRYLFGQAYKITVHPVYHFWEWPLPAFAKSNPDGVDGRYRTNCRASNKPHAVIANGAALQRVPSSMRLLQKLCKKADVPLFVIHDPRVWGGNTHQSLPEALRDMRSTIKNRVISRALEQQGSTAFSRGRMLGQVETEAKWQLKEQKRRSKEVFKGYGRQRKLDGDWSLLDSIRLERRLVERGVIKEKTSSDGEGSSIIQKYYTDALIELARRCVHDVEEQQLHGQEEPTKQAPESSSPAHSSSPSPTKPSTANSSTTIKV